MPLLDRIKRGSASSNASGFRAFPEHLAQAAVQFAPEAWLIAPKLRVSMLGLA